MEMREDTIRELLEAATPRPWKYNPLKCYCPGINGAEPIPLYTECETVFSDTPTGAPIIAITGAADDPQSMANARFIAHAPDAVRYLLDENARLREQLNAKATDAAPQH